jgi:hypothetical protein
VPITLHSQDYDPIKSPGTHARHSSACTPSKISIWLIDTTPEKWGKSKNRQGKRKKSPTNRAKTYAKRLALALLGPIKDGGHAVTTTKWAKGYDLSPDNMINHISGAHTKVIHKYSQIAHIPGIRPWKPNHLQE